MLQLKYIYSMSGERNLLTLPRASDTVELWRVARVFSSPLSRHISANVLIIGVCPGMWLSGKLVHMAKNWLKYEKLLCE